MKKQKRTGITDFQVKCLHAFQEIKLKQGFMVRVDYMNDIGVSTTDKMGRKLFYSLNNIMDPINRLMLAPILHINL